MLNIIFYQRLMFLLLLEVVSALTVILNASLERYLIKFLSLSRLKSRDANFISVDIPGIGLITADMLKADDLVVNIYAGDTLIRHLSATYSNASELDIGTLPIGEELRFEVSSTRFSNVEEATLAGPPTISGMPDLQIIRFAGEAFYYVTPSVVPGGFTPFVGFDSQVHGTVLRAYPDYDFSPRIENWELRSSDLTYHWSFPLK